jgi:hypothetical protein
MDHGSKHSRRRLLKIAGLGGAAWISSAYGQELARPQRLEVGPVYLDADYKTLVQTAQDAYIWGYPLVQMGELFKMGRVYNQPMNRLIVARNTALGTYAPNIELLYGFAYLDVSQEPLVLSVPDTNGRYFSLQFLDFYSNPFTYISKRATGPKGGLYAIVGPDWRGKLPAGMKRISSPHNQLLMQSRTFTGGPEDMEAANAIQDNYRLSPLSKYPGGLAGPATASRPLLELWPMFRFESYGPQYFDLLSGQLAHYPPPKSDDALLARFAQIGIGPNQQPSRTKDDRLLQALRDGIRFGENKIVGSDFATHVNGWAVIYGVGPEIKDPVLRAFTNRLGAGYHTAQEGLYFLRMDGPDGKPLNGSKKYRLRFAAGALPPVIAFWTLSLMRPDSRPTDNPINRHSLAGHTKGLKYGADGSLELQIQHEQPAEGPANWLPAPPDGFRVTLRMYEPEDSAITGAYKPPELGIVES